MLSPAVERVKLASALVQVLFIYVVSTVGAAAMVVDTLTVWVRISDSIPAPEIALKE